ncbi:MAG: WGR domain-containing protein [Cyanobacteriota bacterium]|nr:WGR domain-containing protein [Cyanobacteriota bacterium]
MDTTLKPIERCQLIYVEVGQNSNKVWQGSVWEDGTFLAEWGRVGKQLQYKAHTLGSVAAAKYKLFRMKRQKLAKGYTEARTLENHREISSADLAAIATTQIRSGGDRPVIELIQYLTETNIHQIVSQTHITYNRRTGTFKTPLGLVTADAIAEARQLLVEIATAPKTSDRPEFSRLVSRYLRLIPQDLGMKLDESMFRMPQEVQRQSGILDALEVAIGQTPAQTREAVFNCSVSEVSRGSISGCQTFRQIRQRYRQTLNRYHLASGYQLKRLYEVRIPQMERAFAAKAEEIGNVRQYWHGTRASNLLSILKQGLIIPPISSVQCTGRLFGNGIYGSEQSTKALNYATDYWNRSGNSQQRAFMLLCDFAMGRSYHPQTFDRRFPVKGYDSTDVRPGTAGVINQESIVYSIDQCNIRYLCEFG